MVDSLSNSFKISLKEKEISGGLGVSVWGFTATVNAQTQPAVLCPLNPKPLNP